MLAQVVQQVVTVSNPGHAEAAIQWSSTDGAVEVRPPRAVLLPDSQQQMEVAVTGSRAGSLRAQLSCSVRHGMSHALEVTATVRGEAAAAVPLRALTQAAAQRCQQCRMNLQSDCIGSSAPSCDRCAVLTRAAHQQSQR